MILENVIDNKKREIGSLKIKGERKRSFHKLKYYFKDDINIIAEIKSKSPSKGFIRNLHIHEVVTLYAKYVNGISVLTDKKYFGGSFDILRNVCESVDLPVLCKDFIIDKKQIDLAYICGADIVLLIVRILKKDAMLDLYNHAKSLGLECLVEFHSLDDLDKIKPLMPNIIGVNARDLDNLSIDLNRSKILLENIKIDSLKIAESGIHSVRDIEFLRTFCDGFLIGETILLSDDMERTIMELKGYDG